MWHTLHTVKLVVLWRLILSCCCWDEVVPVCCGISSSSWMIYTMCLSHAYMHTIYIVILEWKNFQKISCQRLWKQYFWKRNRDIASLYCYSVILKLSFQRYLTVFEIFINMVIQKSLCIHTYTSYVSLHSRLASVSALLWR